MSNVEALAKSIIQSKDMPIGAVWHLKKNARYSQVKKVINQVQSIGIDDYLFGMSMARNWEEILSPNKIPASSDWVEEIGWAAHGIIHNAATITHYLHKRTAFGRAYLLGNYPEANSLLDEIEQELGKSLWLAERRLMTLQEAEGFSAQKKHLAHLQLELKRRPLTSYILTTISKRLDPHITHLVYNESVSQALRTLHSNNKDEIAAIVEFHTLSCSFNWTPKKGSLAHYGSQYCIIDKYNTICKISSTISLDDLTKEQRHRLEEILSDIGRAIPLSLINNLLAITPKDTDENTLYNSALKLFLAGKFEEAYTQAENGIRHNPTCFDYYWLTAVSKASANATPDLKIPEGSIARRIVKTLHIITENQNDLTGAYFDLLLLSLRLGDNHLGCALYEFAIKEFEEKFDNKLDTYVDLMGRITAPKLHRSKNGATITKQYAGLEELLSTELTKNQTLHPAFDTYRATVTAFKNGRYEDSIQGAQNITRNPSNLTKQLSLDVLPIEFESHVALDSPIKATSLIIEWYHNRPSYLRHLKPEKLITATKHGAWPELRKSAYWPALTLLNLGETQDIYEALDDYITLNKIPSLKDLIREIDTHPAELAKIIYKSVLTLPVMRRGALWPESLDEKREIRIIALQKLFAISERDQPYVLDEISNIEKNHTLETAYKKVEGPKFILDFTEVNKVLKAVLRPYYSSYSLYKNYESTGGKLASEQALLASATGSAGSSSPESAADTSEGILTRMVNFIVSEYLWNQEKGFNAQLSTRIRHGALENQLKRSFENQDLLATRTADGGYELPNATAQLLEGTGDPQRGEALEAFSHFARRVTEIYNGLMKDALKIKIPSHTRQQYEENGIITKDAVSDKGLLDFSALYDSALIKRLASSNFNELEDLLAELHKLFKTEADSALSKTREYMTYHVSNELEKNINDIETKLTEQIDAGAARTTIRERLSFAKASFHTDIRIINKWFSVTSAIDLGINSPRQLIETAARVVDFASNGKLGKVKEGRVDNTPLESEFTVPIYDVLCILFRNVVQHSGVTSGQEIKCDLYHENSTRVLSVSSLVSSEGELATAVKKASFKLNQPKDPNVLQSAPGGTGLARAKALLSQVSKSPITTSAAAESPRRIIITFSHQP